MKRTLKNPFNNIKNLNTIISTNQKIRITKLRSSWTYLPDEPRTILIWNIIKKDILHKLLLIALKLTS